MKVRHNFQLTEANYVYKNTLFVDLYTCTVCGARCMYQPGTKYLKGYLTPWDTIASSSDMRGCIGSTLPYDPHATPKKRGCKPGTNNRPKKEIIDTTPLSNDPGVEDYKPIRTKVEKKVEEPYQFNPDKPWVNQIQIPDPVNVRATQQMFTRQQTPLPLKPTEARLTEHIVVLKAFYEAVVSGTLNSKVLGMVERLLESTETTAWIMSLKERSALYDSWRENENRIRQALIQEHLSSQTNKHEDKETQ